MLYLDIKFQDCSIFAAGFSSDNKIFVAGRRPHFYSYDIESGVTQTITGNLEIISCWFWTDF